MIKTFQVQGLNGKLDHYIEFNNQLNILTGKNGSGKTTLLKMLWYMISPNLERLSEVIFQYAKVETDAFSVEVNNHVGGPKISFFQPGTNPIVVNMRKEQIRSRWTNPIEIVNRKIQELKTQSVFFPTFRRIEGGFSLDQRQGEIRDDSQAEFLQEGLARFARRISVDAHFFVASISTEDIESLLMRKYSEASSQTTQLHVDLSKSIQTRIGKDKITGKNARQILLSIEKEVRDVDAKRESILAPFNILSDLIKHVYKDKGIRFSRSWTLGNTNVALMANQLSAGEKQMLGFLCYNAFFDRTPIFIDEPELSLHVDWQRSLFGYLLDQKQSNQFIVSTHSPFIYSRYPQFEIVLDKDKGN